MKRIPGYRQDTHSCGALERHEASIVDWVVLGKPQIGAWFNPSGQDEIRSLAESIENDRDDRIACSDVNEARWSILPRD